ARPQDLERAASRRTRPWGSTGCPPASRWRAVSLFWQEAEAPAFTVQMTTRSALLDPNAIMRIDNRGTEQRLRALQRPGSRDFRDQRRQCLGRYRRRPELAYPPQ